MGSDKILIRNCAGFAELQAAVDLQIATWGYDATDVIPVKAFKVQQKIGGQVIGAFDLSLAGAGETGTAETMVGFACSWPGFKAPGEWMGRERVESATTYLHSHMLAVKPEYRNLGIGARVKIYQREDALAKGIRHMEWTFDPLEIKNAFLNLRKLGARCRRYEVDFYGKVSSKLQAGLPSDRLIAEWSMESERVRALVAGEPVGDVEERIEQEIRVPAAIYEWKASATERALEALLRNREEFLKAFAAGLAVVAFKRDGNGDGVYQLGKEISV